MASVGVRRDDDDRLELSCTVCVAGGGPAGMVLGLLLARAGIDVIVLEKHADFLRDFRGDTVHPSTLEVFHDLGLLERLLARPHQRATSMSVVVGGERLALADFTHLPTHAKYIAFMPQHEFLEFVRGAAAAYPSFRLLTSTAVEALSFTDRVVTGVTATRGCERLTIRAKLVVGADGRHSTVRTLAGLAVRDLGSPIDVLWMRLPRAVSDPEQPFAHVDRGQMLVMLNRGDYWQCAYLIRKDDLPRLKAKGLDKLRDAIARLEPLLVDRVAVLNDWGRIKLLTVRVDRLREWARPGLLCIGDAAHAMSPVGGVGINLAIQDAVAAANLLVPCLRSGRAPLAALRRVQARRELPTRLTQAMQVQVHRRFLVKVLADAEGTSHATPRLKVPSTLRWAVRMPRVRRLPAWLIGIGVRPERPRVDVAPVTQAST